jgi:hypothetical protein
MLTDFGNSLASFQATTERSFFLTTGLARTGTGNYVTGGTKSQVGVSFSLLTCQQYT